jgi:hypothetical protein
MGADVVGGTAPLACRASVRWGRYGLASTASFIPRRTRPSRSCNSTSAGGTSEAHTVVGWGYTTSLKDKGDGKQLKSLGCSIRTDASQLIQEPGAGLEAAAFTAEDQRRLQLQAARRLKRLRARRAADAAGAAEEEIVGLNEVNEPRNKITPNDAQLELFLDSEPDPSQECPEIEAARLGAVSGVVDLYRTQTPLGMALSSDYAARQRVSLVGQKVTGIQDLAFLAQVSRYSRIAT